MIVCHCGVVSDRQIVDAIEAGARSAAAVCRATGAGRSCGTCLFSVRQLVRQHECGSDWADAPSEVRSAAG